jgi:di/tricarboxylate transporter
MWLVGNPLAKVLYTMLTLIKQTISPTMAKKKAATKRNQTRRNTVLISAVILAVVIVAVVVFWPHRDDTVKVTAPTGTVSRGDQINTSELSEESGLDTQSDTDQSTNLQSDSTLLGGVSGAADEN